MFALEDIEIPDLEDDIPEYVALISGVSIPGDVTPLSLELPTPPTIETTLDIPDAPVADYGDIPDLLTLDLPTYVAPSLEAFDVDVPEFDALVPSSAVDWAEPEYEAWIADQLKTVLQTMLAGGTGAVTSGADPGRPNRVVWPSTWCMTSSPCLMLVFRLLCTFFDSIANPLAISERVIVPPLARWCSSNLAGSEPAFGA